MATHQATALAAARKANPSELLKKDRGLPGPDGDGTLS